MDTYGEIIVKLDLILMILPHFSFPMSLPPEGGVVDAAVYARPFPQDAAARSQSKKAIDRRPSGVHLHHRRKLRERKSDVEFDGIENSVRAHDVGRCGEDEALGGRDAASSSEPMWRA